MFSASREPEFQFGNIRPGSTSSREPMWSPSSGALFTTIGWLLSATAVLGAFAFLVVRMSVQEFGGQYPPDLIFFLMWPLLLAGAFVSYHGSLMLHKRKVLLFPLAGTVLMLYMLEYVTCVPWLQCVVP